MTIRRFYYFKPKKSFNAMTTKGNPKYLWSENSYRAAPFLTNDGRRLYAIFDTTDMADPCMVYSKELFRKLMAKTHVYDPDKKGTLKWLYDKVVLEFSGDPI